MESTTTHDLNTTDHKDPGTSKSVPTRIDSQTQNSEPMADTAIAASPITTLLNDTNTWANRRTRINALTIRIQELSEDDEDYVHRLYIPALVEGRERLCEIYRDTGRELVERWRTLQAETNGEGDGLSAEEKEKLDEGFQKLLAGGAPGANPRAVESGNGGVSGGMEHPTGRAEHSSTAPVQANGDLQIERWRLFGERIR